MIFYCFIRNFVLFLLCYLISMFFTSTTYAIFSYVHSMSYRDEGFRFDNLIVAILFYAIQVMFTLGYIYKNKDIGLSAFSCFPYVFLIAIFIFFLIKFVFKSMKNRTFLQNLPS